MAGTDPRFDSAAFRDAIHFAMNMAKPGTTSEQLKFVWSDRNTYQRSGPPNEPFDWTDTPVTSHTYGPVYVVAAYEFSYSSSDSAGTPLGVFDQPLLTITILDTDYPTIFDDNSVRADQIEVPGRGVFEILFEAPPIALFDVTVHTLYAKGLEIS